MRDHDHHRDESIEQQLEEQWRAWATRPTQRTPAQAAQRFRANLRSSRRQQPVWRTGLWALTALATTVLLVIALTSLLSPHAPAGDTKTTVVAISAPALGNGEVLIWLDEETPLYMTFQQPDEAAENGEIS